jgi:hypothetical protein
MSLFQCQRCGCAENTALSSQGMAWPENFDWTGIEDRKGLKLCSACGPTKYSDGTATEYGKWHGRFVRTFLPLGMFRTNKGGNLAHVETGDENYRAYATDGVMASDHKTAPPSTTDGEQP